MKKILFYIAAMAMAVGCNDKFEELGADSTTDGESIFVTLRLAMESDDETRVSVDSDSYESRWEAGDVIYLVSTNSDYPTTFSMTYDAENDYFSGSLHTNASYRVYYAESPIDNNISFVFFIDETGAEVFVSTAESPLKPKMVSKGTLDTTSYMTELDPIEMTMQNMTAAVNLNLTLDLEAIFGSDYANYTTLKIGDITLGGDGEDETQYPAGYYSFLGKDLDDADFYDTDEGMQIYNQTLIGTGASDIALSGSTYIYNVMLHSLPFTIEAGDSLPIFFQVELSDSEGNTLITYAAGDIKNSTGADFAIERSNYYTLTKSISESTKGGTVDYPILISTEADLAAIATDAANSATTGVYYKMLNDITLTSDNWTPIGTTSSRFKGNFDGDGYTISGLKVNNPDSYYQGLFGYADGAMIQNVTLFEPSVVGGGNVGALCGYTYSSDSSSADGYTTISNCAVVGGSVTCTGDGQYFVGGLVGCSYYTTFTDCSNSSTVTGSCDYVGGITGYILGSYSSITSCYNTGDITSLGQNVGGIVGRTEDSSISITACYNTGDIKSDSRLGGIAGYNKGSLIACYNTGSVSGLSNVGAIAGYNDTTPTACYYVSGFTQEGYGTLCATLSALNDVVGTMNTEAGATYYTAGDDSHLPSLMGESIEYIGAGSSADNPYMISTATELANIVLGVSGIYYELANDIPLSGTWTPIAFDIGAFFEGYFDGKGYTISGLKIDDPVGSDEIGCGLFRCVGYTTIKNLTISAPSIYGENGVGAICGFARNASFINCHVVGGTIKGSKGYVGGIVGYAEISSDAVDITNCSNTGAVTSEISDGYGSAGGVVGHVLVYSGDINITECYNTGAVTGSSYGIGGVLGSALTTNVGGGSIYITECYNTGDVTGSVGDIGGVVGVVGGALGGVSNIKVTACYNMGDVTVNDLISESGAGGVVGTANGDSWIISCYNTGGVKSSNSGTTIGAIFGYLLVDLESSIITNCYYINTTSADTSYYNSYGTELTTVQMLSNKVDEMNMAAEAAVGAKADGGVYFTAGNPSTSVFPWLLDAVAEYTEYNDGNFTEGYTPGDSLDGDTGL